MKQLKLVLAALLLISPLATHAGLLAGYLPDGAPAAGVTASAISPGPGLLSYSEFPAGTAVTFPSGFNRVDPGNGSTSGALAVTNNDYFEFSLSAQAGFLLDLDTLTFDGAKGGIADPRGWLLRTSVDVFAADVSSGLLTTILGGVTPDSFSVDLQSAAFQGLSSIDFRIYTFSPQENNVLNFGNINVFGDASAVPGSSIPTPTTFALFGLGLVGLGLARRKTT